MNWRIPTTLAVAVAQLSGCALLPSWEAPGLSVIDAAPMHNSLFCSDTFQGPTVQWLDSEKQLATRRQLLGQTDTDFATGNDTEVTVFDTHGALLVAMGQQPSSGYRLNFLDPPGAQLRGGVLEIPVAWAEPDADSAQLAVITSPCLLLNVQKTPFERIKIIDQNGVVRIDVARAAAVRGS